MSQLKEIIAYFIQNYPIKDELSKARLTKMVYLADWECSKELGFQISNIDWYYDNYGPFVWDVIDTVKEESDLFRLEKSNNYFGSEKTIISLCDNGYHPQLDDYEKEIIDGIIDETKTMYWDEFIDHVYSTYPIKISDQYSYLNLKGIAEVYHEDMAQYCNDE